MKRKKKLNRIISLILAIALLVGEISTTSLVALAHESETIEVLTSQMEDSIEREEASQTVTTEETMLQQREKGETVLQLSETEGTEENPEKESEKPEETGMEISAATVITGTLTLPEEAFIRGGKLTGYVRINNGSKYAKGNFTFEEGSDQAQYTVTFNTEIESITSLYLYVDNISGIKTNLVQGKALYYTGEGWSLSSGNAVAVELPAEGEELSFEIPTTLVYGKLQLPEGLILEAGNNSYSVSVYAKVGSSSYSYNTSIKEGDSEVFYSISNIPLETEIISQLYVKVSNNSNIKSNLITGQNEYYNGTKLVTNSGEAVELSVAEGSIEKNLILRKTQVSGTIQLPEEGFYEGGNLQGTVYAKVGNSSYSNSFMIPEGEKSVKFYINNIPADITQLSRMYVKVNNINNNTSIKSNLITNRFEYYIDDDSKLSTQEPDTSQVIEIAEQGKNFDLVLRLTNLHMKFKLSEEAEFSGENLTGTLFVKATGSNSAYSKSITIAQGEKETEFYMNDFPADVGSLSYMYVKWSSSSNLVTNFMQGQNLYYTGNGWTTKSTEITYSLPIDDSLSNVIFDSANIILKVRVMVPEGGLIGGENLTGSVSAKVGSSTYNQKFFLEPGGQYKDVFIALPDETTELTSLSVSLDSNTNVATNLKCGTTLYYTQNGLTASSGEKETVNLANVTEFLPVTMVKTHNISGELRMPEGAFHTGADLAGYVTVKVGNSTYRNNFVLPVGETKITYGIPIPETATTITYVSLYLKNATGMNTNLLKTTTLYYTGEGWSTEAADAMEISITGRDTSLDMTMEKTMSIYGVLQIPEGSFIRGGKVTATVDAYINNSRYSTAVTFEENELREKEYYIILPHTATEVTKIRVTLNKDSSTITNLVTGTYLYLDEEGTLVTDASAAAAISLTNKETQKNLLLQKLPSVSGEIKLPEGGYFRGGTLSGTVLIYDENNNYKSQNFTINEGEQLTEYSIVLSINSTAVKYIRVELSATPNADTEFETNLDLDHYLYSDLKGNWSSNYNTLEQVGLIQSETVHEIVLPRMKSISGTISIPEEAYFTGGDYTGDICLYVNGISYRSDFTIPEGERSTTYQFTLPATTGTISYIRVSSKYSVEDTNLVQETIYQGGNGRWNYNYNLLEPIVLTNSDFQKDIVLECIHTLTGTIAIPEDIYIENGRLSGTISAKVDGTVYSSYFELPAWEEPLTYSIQLPVGVTALDNICVTLSGSEYINTNLLLGSSYYSTVTGTWGGTYLQATSVPITGIETVLDVELKKSVTLSGTISLAEDSYFSGTALNGYLRAYVGDIPYGIYYRMEEGQTSCNYKIQLPVGSQEITKIQIKNYKNSLLDTDVLTDVELYWTQEEWTGIVEDAQKVAVEQENTVLNLVLPKANIIQGRIQLPKGITGQYQGKIVVLSNGSEYTQNFVTNENYVDYRIDLPPEKEQNYKMYYHLDLEDSEVFVTGKVYVNLDDSYALSDEFAKSEVVKNGLNVRNITLAQWSDLNYESLLQSAHPYENGKEYSLSYEYPGTADALTITFSEYTNVEEKFDNIYLYDNQGQLLGDYTGSQLAGKSVRIPGKGFKIVLSSDQNHGYYGFDIDSIVAENGVPDHELAFSLVYENEEARKMMIHNADEIQKSFYVSMADYDETGKMLDLSTRKIVVADGLACANLAINNNPKANMSKLMFYDENFVPICSEQYKVYPKYGITYHYNDGLDSSRVVYIAIGEAVAEPMIHPSKPGYKFTGWYVDNKCTHLYEFGDVLSESIELYAGWKQQYRVLFQTEGMGEVFSEELDDLYAVAGESVSILAKPEDGWKFDCWKLEDSEIDFTENGNTLSFVVPQKDITIKAVFKRELEVQWKSTGVYIENTEVGFNDHTLYVPADVSEVTLQGTIPDTESQITDISYTYSYYDFNEEGNEIYVEGESVSLSIDEEGIFCLENLKVGVGTNTLLLDVTTEKETSTLVYYLLGNGKEVALQEEVTKMDPTSAEDLLKIENLATGIEAFWIYDNETPENMVDDREVLIVTKESEIGQRLMLPTEDENSIGIGSVWLIPACDQFPTGYSFKITDFGDAQYAPAPSKEDMYYGQEFDSEKYLYLLVETPNMVDVFENSFSIQTTGVDGIAFSLLPESTVMECSMVEEDGNEVVTSVGDMMSTADITHPGFQYQNLLSNIIPKATINSNQVGVSFTFGDTVLYDKDGSENTTWDQLVLGGDIGIEDMGVTGAFEYHPSIELRPWKDDFGVNVLPQQVGLLLDYTETRNVKVSVGGTIGGDPKAKDDSPSGEWSLKEVVKSFKSTFGCDGGNTKKNVSVLGFDFDVEGNDMDSTIVLAAVGFNLATLSPVASANYEQIAVTSTYLGFSPIMVLMVCLDIDGSVSAKVAYTYSQSTYNAKGFNVEQKGYHGTNAKIASMKPAKEMDKAGYHIEIFNTVQASKTNKAESVGKHTITATGEAKVNTSLTVGAALLLCGLNIAQLKGGLYADASTALVGSAVLEKGKDPLFDLDGNLNISIGLLVGFYSRLYAKTSIGDFGYDAEWSKKWELMNWGLASMGCSGTITEPSLRSEEKDKPLSDVKVTLTKESAIGFEPQVVYSDSNGKYSFKNLSNGTYELCFEKDGYVKKEEKNINISNQSETKDVSLSIEKYMEVTGKVVDAKTNDTLEGVGLMLVKASDNSIVKYATTDESGNYKFGEKDNAEEGITPGIYKLSATKTKYREAKQEVIVVVSDNGIVETDIIQMVEGSYGNCTISGYIYDIATGSSTGVGLRLRLRKGIGNGFTDVLDEMIIGRDGAYSFDVMPGNYTITVEDLREGINDNQRYHTTSFYVIAVNGRSTKQNGYVSQSANDDQIRIVLTWGSTPWDLDSHLLGPTGDGSARFHTYYANKSYYYNGMKYADLDLDDVSSYGPETTTIYYKNGSGIYSYYVQDYSNRGSTGNPYLASSGATVKVYMGSTLMATYRVPAGLGTVWHVFDYDAGTGVLIPVNTMSNQSDPGMVGTMSLENNMTKEEIDLAIIFNEMVEKE